MSDITWKFTQKQKGRRESRAPTVRRRGAWWSSAKASKDYSERPMARTTSNTSDFRAVLWAHHWSHHTWTRLDSLSLLKCKMPWCHVKKQPFSKRCLNQFPWLALPRVQWGPLGHVMLGWHWNVFSHRHKSTIIWGCDSTSFLFHK